MKWLICAIRGFHSLAIRAKRHLHERPVRTSTVIVRNAGPEDYHTMLLACTTCGIILDAALYDKEEMTWQPLATSIGVER